MQGGKRFSLSDSCFAYGYTIRNLKAVALDTAINFIKPVHIGDILTAEAKEIYNGKSTGLYHITVTYQNNHTVAFFTQTCSKTNKAVVSW